VIPRADKPFWTCCRRRRPFPVGRLDLLSTGLLLLTTDGELALRMTHPRWEHPKTYHVLVRGRVTRRKLEIMRQGMRLAEGELLAPVHARILRHVPPDPGCATLELILRQGVNRQIRRMCRDLHLHIRELHRVAQGPIHLGNLAPGAWRHLAPHEISALRDSLDPISTNSKKKRLFIRHSGESRNPVSSMTEKGVQKKS